MPDVRDDTGPGLMIREGPLDRYLAPDKGPTH